MLNNHGGGIFSLLPISQKTEIFDHFFGAQHDYNFRNIAKMFDLNYFNPKSIADFELKYKKAIIENKSSVLEIFTNRHELNKKLNDIHKKTKKIIV